MFLIVPITNIIKLRLYKIVSVRRALTFVPAKTVDTVLETALNRPQEAAPALLSPIPETAIRKRKPKPGIQQ